MFQPVSVPVRWPGKMAAGPASAGEHSFFLGFFVSFFAKKKRKERANTGHGKKSIHLKKVERKVPSNSCFPNTQK